MLYNSLNNLSKSESFKEAVIKGIAPDKGLYYPNEIKSLSKKIIKNLDKYTIHNIEKNHYQFVGNTIPEKKLKSITGLSLH